MKISNKKRKVILNTIDMHFMKICQEEGIDFSGGQDTMSHIQEAQFNALTNFVAKLGARIVNNLEAEKPNY